MFGEKVGDIKNIAEEMLWVSKGKMKRFQVKKKSIKQEWDCKTHFLFF